jgi:hypothetical protein
MSCHVNTHSFTISRQYSSRPRFLSALFVPKENLSTAFYAALMKAALGPRFGCGLSTAEHKGRFVKRNALMMRTSVVTAKRLRVTNRKHATRMAS